MAFNKRIKERNWTEDETTLLCQILADPTSDFVTALESRALKKAPTRDIFADIVTIFNTELQKKHFVDINMKNFSEKKHYIALNVDIRKLQAKYNNIKTKWREHSTRLAKGIGLPTKERWYMIMDPLFADRKIRQRSVSGFESVEDNKVYVSVEWNEEDVYNEFNREQHFIHNHSVAQQQDNGDSPNGAENNGDSYYKESGNPHDNHHNDVENERQETSSDFDQRNSCGNEDNRNKTHTHTDALFQLAASINKLADVNAKRLKLEYENRDAQLKYRKEEAEANRRHELQMAQLSNCCHQRRVFPDYYINSMPYRPTSSTLSTHCNVATNSEESSTQTDAEKTSHTSPTHSAEKYCQTTDDIAETEKSSATDSLDVHI